MPSPLYKFLDRFGEPLAQRVAQTFQVLHDPFRDAGTTPDYDTALAALSRRCYPAQAEAAKALAKAFFVAGDNLRKGAALNVVQIAEALAAARP